MAAWEGVGLQVADIEVNGANVCGPYISHMTRRQTVARHCSVMLSGPSPFPLFRSLAFDLLLNTDGRRKAIVASSITVARGTEGTATHPSVVLLRKVNAAPEPSSAELPSHSLAGVRPRDHCSEREMLETKHLARGWGFMTGLWNGLITLSVPQLRVCFQDEPLS